MLIRELSTKDAERGVEGELEVLPVEAADDVGSLLLAAGLGLIIMSTEHELNVISDHNTNKPASAGGEFINFGFVTTHNIMTYNN